MESKMLIEDSSSKLRRKILGTIAIVSTALQSCAGILFLTSSIDSNKPEPIIFSILALLFILAWFYGFSRPAYSLIEISQDCFTYYFIFWKRTICIRDIQTIQINTGLLPNLLGPKDIDKDWIVIQPRKTPLLRIYFLGIPKEDNIPKLLRQHIPSSLLEA